MGGQKCLKMKFWVLNPVQFHFCSNLPPSAPSLDPNVRDGVRLALADNVLQAHRGVRHQCFLVLGQHLEHPVGQNAHVEALLPLELHGLALLDQAIFALANGEKVDTLRFYVFLRV